MLLFNDFWFLYDFYFAIVLGISFCNIFVNAKKLANWKKQNMIIKKQIIKKKHIKNHTTTLKQS